MRKVVLYSPNMEPITVIDLSEMTYQYLRRARWVNLPIPPKNLKIGAVSDAAIIPKIGVEIVAEIVVVRRQEHMILTTSDDGCALLNCAFLPGQEIGIQEHEKAAFDRGVIHAVSRLGKDYDDYRH